MRFQHLKRGLVILLACAVICACARQGHGAPPQPQAGLGGLSGSLSAAAARWPEQTLWVFAAPYYGETQREGFYVLDATVHPQTRVGEDGSFRLIDVQPGRYVLVAGPSAEEGLAALDEEGSPRVFEVRADQVTNLGALSLSP